MPQSGVAVGVDLLIGVAVAVAVDLLIGVPLIGILIGAEKN